MLMIHTLCPARPHWPWTLFMRMESFPILLLAVRRSASRMVQQTCGVHEHIRKPRAYNNCRSAGHWLHCSTAHTSTRT